MKGQIGAGVGGTLSMRQAAHPISVSSVPILSSLATNQLNTPNNFPNPTLFLYPPIFSSFAILSLSLSPNYASPSKRYFGSLIEADIFTLINQEYHFIMKSTSKILFLNSFFWSVSIFLNNNLNTYWK